MYVTLYFLNLLGGCKYKNYDMTYSDKMCISEARICI